MSDPVRDFINAPVVVIGDDEIMKRRQDKAIALKALDREREAYAKEVADLKQHVDESRQVLTKCLSILRRTPPNYYDYGPNNDYSMGEQDKISLLEILSKILKDPLDVLRGMF
jgi:hypothetical protein